MKKQCVMFLVLIALFSLVFVGCPKADDPSPPQTPLSLDFETSAGSAYTSKGTPLDTPTNAILDTMDGHNAFVFHVDSVDENDSIGGEIQWDLSEATDLSAQDFTVTFDYYIANGIGITGIQYSFFTSSYTPIYSILNTSNLTTGTWHTITMNVDEASIGWDGFASSSTADSSLWSDFSKFRIQFITAIAGDDVLVYIDNVVVTNE